MRIALVLPAYNEENTIREVIGDFHRQLPDAVIYVVDNASTDKTGEYAASEIRRLKCRGQVLEENQKGKAFAVRRAFSEIHSDLYIIADADRTYPAEAVKKLMDPVLTGEADMTVGDRLTGGSYRKQNRRVFHGFGNQLVKSVINFLFRTHLRDIMSGYRVFSRKFVKNFPVLSKGFEIETEMTLHALDKRFRIAEVPVRYSDRPAGSVSKLRTVRDGFLVLKTIFGIFRHYKPMSFFSALAAVCLVGALAIGAPVIMEYLRFQYVYKVPSAILSTGLMIFSMLLYSVGLILDTVAANNKFLYEMNLLNYSDEGLSKMKTGRRTGR